MFDNNIHTVSVENDHIVNDQVANDQIKTASSICVGPTESKQWDVVLYNNKPSWAIPISESNTWEVVVASNKDEWLVPKVDSWLFPKVSWVIPKFHERAHSLECGERFMNIDMVLASALRRRFAEEQHLDGEALEYAWAVAGPYAESARAIARVERWEEEKHLLWEEEQRFAVFKGAKAKL
ncbi:hypothetical protein C8R47DRAFT_1076224 [Mycena vitilis]|nr:hypothetical protein C8R47DRAFT_1076224 [Mycena vitilis]